MCKMPLLLALRAMISEGSAQTASTISLMQSAVLGESEVGSTKKAVSYLFVQKLLKLKSKNLFEYSLNGVNQFAHGINEATSIF